MEEEHILTCPLKHTVMETSVSPLHFDSTKPCSKESCAWYDAAAGQCAILALAQASRPQS